MVAFLPFSAWAANECGVGVSGGTVTCNNDGSPASDSNPYPNGITYSIPVNLVVDGTVNPITSAGRITVTSGAGPQTTTLLGSVSVIRAGDFTGAAIGDGNAQARNITLNLGAGTVVNSTMGIANRTLQNIVAGAANGKIVVNSSATIVSNYANAGNGSSRIYYFNDDTGGANAGITADIDGSIEINVSDGGSVLGIYANVGGAGSVQTVSIDNEATIDINATGTQSTQIAALMAQNDNRDVYIRSAGEINVMSETSPFIRGVRAQSLNGDVKVDSLAAITLSGYSSAHGIWSTSTNGLSTVNVQADMDIYSRDSLAYGIYVVNGSDEYDVTVGPGVEIMTRSASAVASQSVSAAYLRADSGVFRLSQNAKLTSISDGLIAPETIYATGDYDITIESGAIVEAISTGAGNSTAIRATSTVGDSGTIYIEAGATISATATTGNNLALYGGSGEDTIISYGDLIGNIRVNNGNDTISLLGGSLTGDISMGDGDDVANITDMTTSGLQNIEHINGLEGNDTLNFTNIDYFGLTTAVDDLSLGINLNGWETINFVNSDWRLTGDLTLGGSTVNIDSTSTLYAGNGVNPVISSLIPNDPAIVNNAGLIDLTNGAGGATDSLTILGDYVGVNGDIRMNIAINGSSIQSDRLIIDGSNGGGSATGNSVITLLDTQFLGAATPGNGILLVETRNGATSTNGAFVLSSPVLTVGAYTYRLEINDANDNWYLVSGFAPRDEIAADVTLSDLSHRLGLAMLGRMDDRQNDDGRKFWARSFGQFGQVGETENFSAHGPQYDYTVAGGQMGMDIYRTPAMEKTRNVVGVYGASGHIKADVAAPAGGNAGVSQMTGYSVGAYWSHFAAQGWYMDAALQGTFYDNVRSRSSSGETLTTHGYGAMASVEGGKPYLMEKGLTLTPQVQVTAQKTKLNDSGDSFGLVDFRDANAVYTRVGAKLNKTLDIEDGPLFENGPVDVWVMPGFTQSFGADAKTVVTNLSGGGASTFRTDLGGSALLLNTGISAHFSQHVSLFTAAEYSTTLSRNGNALAGKMGIRVTW